jgi:hypothetical protein
MVSTALAEMERSDWHSMVVAVGAGHMVGEIGLVQLLRDRGYEMERLGGDQGAPRCRSIAIGVPDQLSRG